MLDRLVDFLLQSLRFFRPWFVMPAYGAGVILRMGRVKKVIGPGFHWLIPFNVDDVVWTNTTVQPMLIGPQMLMTRDGLTISISTVMLYQVWDVKKFVVEIEGVEEIIAGAGPGIVGRFVRNRTWQEICEPDFVIDVGEAIAEVGEDWGIRVLSFDISSLVRTRVLSIVTPPAKTLYTNLANMTNVV